MRSGIGFTPKGLLTFSVYFRVPAQHILPTLRWANRGRMSDKGRCVAGGLVYATGGMGSKTVPISSISGAGGTGKARRPPGAEILRTESKR
jgi:hypothetical protein